MAADTVIIAITVAPPRPIRLRSARITDAPEASASSAAYIPAPPAPTIRTSVSRCVTLLARFQFRVRRFCTHCAAAKVFGTLAMLLRARSHAALAIGARLQIAGRRHRANLGKTAPGLRQALRRRLHRLGMDDRTGQTEADVPPGTVALNTDSKRILGRTDN